MFEIFEDHFADTLQEHFDVLQERYVQDKADDILDTMQHDFDQMFDTRFLLLRNGTGQPAYRYLFDCRKSADSFKATLPCNDDIAVCMVLVDK